MKKILLILIMLFLTTVCFAAEGTFFGGKDKIKGKGNSLSLQNKGEIVILAGKASVLKDGFTVSSDKILIYQKETKFNAIKNVKTYQKYVDTKDEVNALSDELWYYGDMSTTVLTKVSSLKYFVFKDTKTVTMRAEEISINETDGVIIATGNVHVFIPFVEEDSKKQISKGTYTFTADEINLNKNTKDTHAKGNVYVEKVYDDGSYIRAKGETLDYVALEKRAVLDGLDWLKYVVKKGTETTTVIIKGDKMEFDEKENIVKIINNVQLIREEKQMRVKSGLATYYKDDDHIIFAEKPAVYQLDEKGVNVYKGDTIYYYPSTQDVSINGKVDMQYFPKNKLLK